MAETITIARPYAEAAFKLARERNVLAQWSQMLEFLDVVARDDHVARCIGNPNVSREQLEAMLLGICGDRLDGAGRNFVQVLVQNGRLAVIPEIRTLYAQLKLEHEGTLEAQILSAFPIDDAQVAQLAARLESKYQRKVRTQVSVDPRLIGGVKIVIGDNVIDATVRGRLDAMSAALTR
jgi:F-type H+-transporting ATPase subunit delta